MISFMGMHRWWNRKRQVSGQVQCENARIDFRIFQPLMPQQRLHLFDMGSVHQQVNRIAVTERVRRHRVHLETDPLRAGACKVRADPIARRLLLTTI